MIGSHDARGYISSCRSLTDIQLISFSPCGHQKKKESSEHKVYQFRGYQCQSVLEKQSCKPLLGEKKHFLLEISKISKLILKSAIKKNYFG